MASLWLDFIRLGFGWILAWLGCGWIWLDFLDFGIFIVLIALTALLGVLGSPRKASQMRA